VARLIDTTLRLLGQDPLAGRIPTGRLMELASRLDGAGFHALEVTGGGCFRAAVARGSETPWERIRQFRQRCTETPLAMALRGAFLVGGRPAAPDLVRRFILCAAESGIEIFRLHDPLNDADDLEPAANAIREAGARLYAALVYADAPGGDEFLAARAQRLRELGADRIILSDPAGQLDPITAGRLIEVLRGAVDAPVGLYCQGPGGTALAVALDAVRAGADPIAAASYPVAVAGHRAPSELLTQALENTPFQTSVDVDRAWGVAEEIDRLLGSVETLPPVPPHVSLLAALNRVNSGLIANLELRLARIQASDRLTAVLDEFQQIRSEVGSPPTASPIGTVIVRQAVDHVLSGRRWQHMTEEMRQLVLGEWGQTPGPIAPEVVAVAQAQEPAEDAIAVPGIDEARALAEGLASSEEELCLIALFGDDARAMLERIRGRDFPNAALGGSPPQEVERVRQLVELLEESNAGELTVEEGQTRITVRRQEERPFVVSPAATSAPVAVPDIAAPVEPEPSGLVVSSPMVGNFFPAAKPGDSPFVEIGDRVEVGQVLCLLEAMKLFNELKSEHGGVVRRILAEDGSPVEFGQPLFELQP
jgi:oxaloacetate decarboxylase (Na+ extruding) subunit alpha